LGKQYRIFFYKKGKEIDQRSEGASLPPDDTGGFDVSNKRKSPDILRIPESRF
jgi:hypothetical protein